MYKSTTVVSQVKIPGFHNWETCDIPEVSFLKDRHRHLFIVKVEVYVTHSDRDVEFFVLQRDIRASLNELYTIDNNGEIGFNSRSCEMIASDVMDTLSTKGYRVCSVTVSEDGENAAIVKSHLSRTYK